MPMTERIKTDFEIRTQEEIASLREELLELREENPKEEHFDEWYYNLKQRENEAGARVHILRWFRTWLTAFKNYEKLNRL